jgi:hypothetical protein
MTIAVRPRPRTRHLHAAPSRPSSVRAMPPVAPTLPRSPMAPAAPCLRRAGRSFFHPHTSAQACNSIGCSSCRSMAAMAAFLGPFESAGATRSPCALAAAHCLLSAILGATQCSTAFAMQTASRQPELLQRDTAELSPAHGGDGHHHDSTTGLYALRYSPTLPTHSLRAHARPPERTRAIDGTCACEMGALPLTHSPPSPVLLDLTGPKSPLFDMAHAGIIPRPRKVN